ncbi:hypothetical protein JN531_005105 [Flagellatimonas centrodinii]|uniref:hypothetical protein n=1 Tax=Flagellatimonas centrodinii TaxID=2806210 RepID=UPI001FEFC67B|nr:hypothetical protein [Flagellatimonas centrodinii]ULQ47667.1 hypothetical protein JN531_005105 [Flagellatimonas centrodinii]
MHEQAAAGLEIRGQTQLSVGVISDAEQNETVILELLKIRQRYGDSPWGYEAAVTKHEPAVVDQYVFAGSKIDTGPRVSTYHSARRVDQLIVAAS